MAAPRLTRRHLNIVELLLVWFVVPHRKEAVDILESASITAAEADAALAAISAITGTAAVVGGLIQVIPTF